MVPTEVRVLAILLNTAIFFIGTPTLVLPFFGEASYYSLVVGILVFIMAIYFLVNGALQTRRLKLLDEKRLERKLTKEENEDKSNNSNPAAATVGEG